MSIKNLGIKTLLVALCLCVGSVSAWAETETFGAAKSTGETKDVAITGTAVNIAAGSNPGGMGQYEVFNSGKDKGLKLRTLNGSTPLTLTVNEGYKVTNVTIYAYQNNEADAVMTCDGYSVDGGEANTFDTPVTLPLNVKNASTQSLATISTGTIEATSSIVFNFTNPASGNNQILAYIEVTYEEDLNIVYTKGLSEWTSNDVTKTEGTVGKWYNSTGITNNEVYTGMMINAEKGLRVAARNTTSTATLKFDHTPYSIITIDAVWNVGSASADGNTPNNKFTFGNLTIQQNVRSNNVNTSISVNGSNKQIGTDLFAREDDMTIHLRVNSFTGEITEFSIKNGETEVATLSNLSSTSFTYGATYDEITMTSWISASSSYAWCALKSITIAEKEQEAFSYTVNAVDESKNILFEMASGVRLATDNSVTISYNAFYLNEGKLLQADRLSTDGKEYKYTFSVDEDDKVVDVVYKDKGYNNVCFYQEAEDIATLTSVNSGNVPVRCSGGKGGYAASDAVITMLPAGTYTVSSFAYGNSGTELSIYAGTELIHTFVTASTTLSVTTSEEFTLNKATDIIFKQGGNGGSSPKVLDYIFIQGTPSEIVGSTDFTTPYWNKWNTTPVVINAGETGYYKIVNHNNGGNPYENWYLYAANDNKNYVVLRADNAYNLQTVDDVAYNGTISSFPTTDNLVADLNEATVELYVTLEDAGDKTYTMTSTAVITKADGTTMSPNYVFTQTGLPVSSLNLFVSVEKSWLEVLEQKSYPTSVPVSVSSVGYATLCPTVNLDFSGVTNIEACTATVEGTAITYTPVTTVAAGEGVLLRSVSGGEATASVPVILSAEPNANNDFVGITEKQKLAQSTETGYTNYILTMVNDELGFYKVNSNGSWVNAGTAYLKVVNTSSARNFFPLWDEEATGIAAAKNAANDTLREVYTLQGVRVAIPKKGGLYIVNGKKMIIK